MSTRILNETHVASRPNDRGTDLRFESIHTQVPSVIDDLMAAGIILPAQMSSPARDWSPEKRLAGAVLASALSDIRTLYGQRGHQRRVTEALDWVHSSDTTWPYSFLRLCGLFGLDPEWVRAEVMRWMVTPHRERRRMPLRHAA